MEAKALPVGCVTSISGATRLEVTITGMAGHAGTVPMGQRRDSLAAAADCVLAVEERCGAEPDLVGTVGRLEVTPGAINVIPGRCELSLDVRAGADATRDAAIADIKAAIEEIAQRRQVSVIVKEISRHRAVPCSPRLQVALADAVATMKAAEQFGYGKSRRD